LLGFQLYIDFRKVYVFVRRENRMLRIFGPKRDEVTRGLEKTT
jgi:hypothetical protein